jgi:hypothetical protein
MLSWIAKKQVSRTMAQARAGNLAPTLRLYAKNVRYRFPGKNVWSTELEGKDKLERWLRTVEAAGVKLYPDEVIIKGFPWKQTVCIRGHDLVTTPTGERVYENRFVLWGRISWGLMRDYEAYGDTEKIAELEKYLARRS